MRPVLNFYNLIVIIKMCRNFINNSNSVIFFVNCMILLSIHVQKNTKKNNRI